MPFDGFEKLEDWQRLMLDAAREIRKGWCQFALQDDHGNVCALGALARVACGDAEDSGARFSHPGFQPAFNKLTDAVDNIPCWNNAPGRTAEEVASTMERVALAPITATVE